MDKQRVSDGGDPGAVPDAADGDGYARIAPGDRLYVHRDAFRPGADFDAYVRDDPDTWRYRLTLRPEPDAGYEQHDAHDADYCAVYAVVAVNVNRAPTPVAAPTGRPEAHGVPLAGDERPGDERLRPGAPLVAGGAAAGGRGGRDGGRPEDGGGVRHDAGAAAGDASAYDARRTWRGATGDHPAGDYYAHSHAHQHTPNGYAHEHAHQHGNPDTGDHHAPDS
jgi:hypothetical protein